MNKEGNFVLLGVASLIVVFVLSFVSASSDIIQVSDVEVPLPSACESLLNSTSGNLIEVRINLEEGVFYFKYLNDKKRFSAGEYSVCFDGLKSILENGESIVGNVKIVDLNSISISKFGITGNAVAGKKKDAAKTLTAESTTANTKKNKAVANEAVAAETPTESVVRTSASFDGTVTTPTDSPQIDAIVDYRGGKYFDFADRKRSNIYIGSDDSVYFQRPAWGDIFTDYLLNDVKIGTIITTANGRFIQLDDNALEYLGEDLFKQLNYKNMPLDLSTSEAGIVGSVKNALNILNGNNAKAAAGTKSSGSKVNAGTGVSIKCSNAAYAVANPKKCTGAVTGSSDCTDKTYLAAHLSECYNSIVEECSKDKYAKAHPEQCGYISNPCIDEDYATANPDVCGGEVGDCSKAKYANANQELCCASDSNYAAAHQKICQTAVSNCADSCSQQCGAGSPTVFADSSSGGGGYYPATIAGVVTGAVVTPLPTTKTTDCYSNCVSACQGRGGSSSGGSSGGSSSGRGTSSGGGTSGGGSSGKGGAGTGKTPKGACTSGDAAKTVKCPKGEEGLHTQECREGQWVDGVNNCKAKSDTKECTNPPGKAGAVSKSYDSCPANPTTTYSAKCTDGVWVPDMSNCVSKDCTSSRIGTVKDGATKSDYGVCKDGTTKYPATCTKGTMVENKNICPDYGGCSVNGKIYENDAIIDSNKCSYCSEGKATDYCVEQGKGEVCDGKGNCVGSKSCTIGDKTYKISEAWQNPSECFWSCTANGPKMDDPEDLNCRDKACDASNPCTDPSALVCLNNNCVECKVASDCKSLGDNAYCASDNSCAIKPDPCANSITGKAIATVTGFATSSPCPEACGDGICTAGEEQAGECKKDCGCSNALYKSQHVEECDKKKPEDKPKNPDKPTGGFESESGGGGGARMTGAAIFRTGKPVFGYGR